jgi:hypothetical protein
MDNRILEIYKLLQLNEHDWPDANTTYDMNTPYEKCSATISVPTTASDKTIVVPRK